MKTTKNDVLQGIAAPRFRPDEPEPHEFALGESVVLRREFRGTDPDRARRLRWPLVCSAFGLLISLAFLIRTCYLHDPFAVLGSIVQDGLRLQSVAAWAIVLPAAGFVGIHLFFLGHTLYFSGLLPLGVYDDILHPDSLEIVRFNRSRKFLFSSHHLRIVRNKLAYTYNIELENSSGRVYTLHGLTYKEMSALDQYYEAGRDPARGITGRADPEV